MFTKFKITIILSLSIILNTYGQEDYNYWVLEQRTPDWALEIFKDLKLNDSLRISDFVNPFYFEEDFNGDSKLDIALLVENKRNSKKGILLIHGSSKSYFLLGANTLFDGKIDDFSWLDSWNVYRSSRSHELLYNENFDITGTREITVHNPCIEVIKLEASSALIFWRGQEYVLVSTSE